MDINELLYNTDSQKCADDSLEAPLRRLMALETVVDNFDALIFVADLYTDKLIFVNRAFAGELGTSPEELLGHQCGDVLRLWASNSDELDPSCRLLGEDGNLIRTSHTREFRNYTSGKWYLVRCSLIKWVDGKLARIEIATEITGQKQYEERLRHLASTDDMTGLYLREYGSELIRHILSSSAENHANSLVFIDLDGLKRINDRYGHAAGDRMLIKLVEFVSGNIRKSDTLCRWGGDEFVLILHADTSEAEQIVEKILGKIEEFNSSGVEEIPLRFSYGVTAIIPGSEKSVDTLISEADRRMYEQKAKRGAG